MGTGNLGGLLPLLAGQGLTQPQQQPGAGPDFKKILFSEILPFIIATGGGALLGGVEGAGAGARSLEERRRFNEQLFERREQRKSEQALARELAEKRERSASERQETGITAQKELLGLTTEQQKELIGLRNTHDQKTAELERLHEKELQEGRLSASDNQLKIRLESEIEQNAIEHDRRLEAMKVQGGITRQNIAASGAQQRETQEAGAGLEAEQRGAPLGTAEQIDAQLATLRALAAGSPLGAADPTVQSLLAIILKKTGMSEEELQAVLAASGDAVSESAQGFLEQRGIDRTGRQK